jgi:outer membrane protein W
MKYMGNSKCITFNEFISDALTQENNDKIYAASKTHKTNFEAGASQSKAPVVSKTQYRPPTASVRYHPPQKKNQAKTSFGKGYTISLSKNTSGQGSFNVPPSNWPC